MDVRMTLQAVLIILQDVGVDKVAGGRAGK